MTLNDILAFNNGKCSICGLAFQRNGVGPAGNGEFTKFLNSLPSSHIFAESANLHDVFYHYKLSEKDRKRVDDIFLARMLIASEKRGGKLSWWYKLQAYRNYWCVRAFGAKFVGKCAF
jgi:hypothetical protein